jgi:hypothetical protein
MSSPKIQADYCIFALRGGAVLLLYPWFDAQPKLPPTERHNCCMVIREGPLCIESVWIGVEEARRGLLCTIPNRPTEQKLLLFVPSLLRVAGMARWKRTPASSKARTETASTSR